MMLKILDLSLHKKLSLLVWFMQLDDLEKIGLTSKQVIQRDDLHFHFIPSSRVCSICSILRVFVSRYITYSGGLQEEYWNEKLLCNILLFVGSCIRKIVFLARILIYLCDIIYEQLNLRACVNHLIILSSGQNWTRNLPSFLLKRLVLY